jgi:L-arabinose transport system ATP-binding protein
LRDNYKVKHKRGYARRRKRGKRKRRRGVVAAEEKGAEEKERQRGRESRKQEVGLVEQFLEFCNVSKAFPGVQALKDVSFRVDGGRVCALLGENGAGKSTLLKILSGDLQPDEGHLSLNGEAQRFASPYQSIKASISVIYQERQLVNSLNVMENVFLEDLPGNKLGFINKSELRRRTQEIIDIFGLPIRPTDIVGRLSVAHQQMVEIMKSYRRDSKIIAFDEPTACLTDTEVTILFRLIKQLKEKGKIILYVSHRMAEIFQVTDEIVVLKDGRLVKTFKTSETNEKELVKAMVGRDIGDTYANLKRNDKIGDVLLEVNNLETDDVHDVSFQLRRGEVLGFAGLVGAGRTEVMRALFGADPIISGEIKIDGKPVHFKSPRDAIDHGIALCPEDRKEQGLVLGRSIRDNVSMPVLAKVKKGLFLDEKTEDELADEAVKRYSIKTPTIEKLVMELSGGNQQKVILGRWTSDKVTTRILILDEPTKGIDVGTKAEVYQMVCDFAKQGIGVIFISSELTEVLNVSDNIIVMHNGRITGKVTRQEATEERVLELAMRE